MTFRGTGRDYSLRRLSREAPELHAKVLAGQLSAHAAAVQAGFTPPIFTVRATTAESIAATLRRQLSPEILAKVVDELAIR